MTLISELEKLLPLVGKISPIVATALGSPVAGLIVSALCHVFGVNSPEALTGVITTDPLAEIKIKQIEAQVTAMQAKADIQAKEIADRQDARAKKVASRDDWVIHFLALVTTIGLFGYVGCFEAGLIAFNKEVFHQLVLMETIVLMFYF